MNSLNQKRVSTTETNTHHRTHLTVLNAAALLFCHPQTNERTHTPHTYPYKNTIDIQIYSYIKFNKTKVINARATSDTPEQVIASCVHAGGVEGETQQT